MMQPGRELDALVAEKVMSWEWVSAEGEDPADLPCLVGPGPADCFYPRVAERYPELPTAGGTLPAYSTDIAAAWTVVEKMRQHSEPRFRTLRLVAYSYNRTYATFDSSEDSDDWAEGNGEHATEFAICLAGLAVP